MTTDNGEHPQSAEETAKSGKIIKRYSNRKLYDTDRSKYVTLDEIARMIKAGEEVTIIDNETKEDLTSVTLTQIIFEEEKRESRMPLSMLRNLIQTGGVTLQEFFDRSVKAPVVEIKDSAQKSVENLRDVATRSVTEWTDTARRVFTRDAEAKRVEEFRRSYTASLEELARRIDGRLKDIASAREQEKEHLGKGTSPTDFGLPRVQDDVEVLRTRFKELNTLVDELERAGRL